MVLFLILFLFYLFKFQQSEIINKLKLVLNYQHTFFFHIKLLLFLIFKQISLNIISFYFNFILKILLSDEQKINAPYQAQYKGEHTFIRNTDRDIPQDADQDFKQLFSPHIDSYNYFISQGLDDILECNKEGYTFISKHTGDQPINIKCTKLSLQSPSYTVNKIEIPLTPQLCRDNSLSYTTQLQGIFQITQGSVSVQIKQSLGQIPVMVGSNLCILSKCKNQFEKINNREDTRDFGGYFINHGGERLIRMLILPKANIVLPVIKSAFTKRGTNFTEYGVQYKCVRQDQRTQTLVLHYLKNGTIVTRLLIDKKEYFIPVQYILTALGATSQKEIYNQIVHDQSETFISERLQLMFQIANEAGLYQQHAVLNYLGQFFRLPAYPARDDLTNSQIGIQLLKDYLIFSQKDNQQKINLLCTMIRKLYLLAEHKISAENQDALSCQDCLVVGHLFTAFLSEQIYQTCRQASFNIIGHAKAKNFMLDEKLIQKQHILKSTIDAKFRQLISTGNLNSESGLDLLQQNSFSLTAEKLNFMRFLAHFRSIHRGAFFADIKSTAPRRQKPEMFGFLCCVNSPDGAACGLLNHLSQFCNVACAGQQNYIIQQKLIQLIQQYEINSYYTDNYCVQVSVNDYFIGYCSQQLSQYIKQILYIIKCQKQLNYEIIDTTSNSSNQEKELHIITTAARFCRKILFCNREIYISPYEQNYLTIDSYKSDKFDVNVLNVSQDQQFTEIVPYSFLSVIAGGIVYLPYNQSPRNMYECQMLKQTMGFTAMNLDQQFTSKTYRIFNPQKRLLATDTYRRLYLDAHPQGTNLVVAVLCYSAYDMEDSVLINKAALDRQLLYGTVYHTVEVNLAELSNQTKATLACVFKADGKVEDIDIDGMPLHGKVLTTGDVLCQYFDISTGKFHNVIYDNREDGIVDSVMLIRDGFIKTPSIAKIRIRNDRTPIVGDKFASASGQKGTLSLRYHGSTEFPFDMQNGITPDFIINSSAFPSRMTIGMLLDAAGCVINSERAKDVLNPTSFIKNYQYDTKESIPNKSSQPQDELAVYKQISKELINLGMNQYMTSIMISPFSSMPLQVPIYMGINYYQRLRHMVNDKYQARAEGQIDQVTFQPIKGRSRFGGVRLGEMEKDAIVAHGVAEVLADRFYVNSDQVLRQIDGKYIKTVAVFDVLRAELSGMGIMLKLTVN